MSPTLTPDTDYYSITGSKAVIRPTGSDDYSNIQTVFNALANDPNSEIEFQAGLFYSSYQLLLENFAGTIRGKGMSKTRLIAGTASAPLALLDATDRPLYSLAGWPTLIVAKPGIGGLNHCDVIMQDMELSSAVVKSQTGTYLFGQVPSVPIRGMIWLAPLNAQPTVPNVLISFAGGDVQPVGVANATSPDVYSGLNGTGIHYTEGTDYTVDATSNITRLGGGSIPALSSIYLTYNNGANYTNIAFSGLRCERVKFSSGYVHYDTNGLKHTGAGNSVVVGLGFPWSWTNNVPGYVAYDSLGICADPVSVPTIQTGLITNGICRLIDCEWTDQATPVWMSDFEGNPGSGPYTFQTENLITGRRGTVKRAVLEVAGGSMRRCNLEAWATFNVPLFLEHMSLGVRNIHDVEMDNCHGAVSLNCGAQWGTLRLPGWVGGPSETLVENINARNIVSNHGGDFFAQPIIRIWNSGGSLEPLVPNLENIEISGCTFELSPTLPFDQQRVFVVLDDHQNVRYRDNVYISAVAAGPTGLRIRGASTVQLIDNDFSNFTKAAGITDVHLDGSTLACVFISKHPESDLILDQAGGTIRVGGTYV